MLYLRNRVAIILLSILSVYFTGCSDDSETINQEDHFQAIGMVVTDASGARVVSILRGVTTDTLIAPLDARSEAYFVDFYDDNENIIDPPTSADKYLAWEIGNPDLASVFQHEGEEGGYEFHLDGKIAGETTIQFFIMHNGHADYRSGLIPLKIKNVVGAHGDPVKVKIVDEESDSLIALADLQSVVSGEVNINAGVTTDHMVVYFIDSEGVEFQPSIADHSLGFIIANSAVASITGQVITEPWAFKISGLTAGTTTLVVQLKHGDTIAKSFSPISIKVN
ncbi:MAG: hypothetical protein V1773_16250 [bacterium]